MIKLLIVVQNERKSKNDNSTFIKYLLYNISGGNEISTDFKYLLS